MTKKNEVEIPCCGLSLAEDHQLTSSDIVICSNCGTILYYASGQLLLIPGETLVKQAEPLVFLIQGLIRWRNNYYHTGSDFYLFQAPEREGG